ncbi:hypothetical protein P153DRAFT_383416 [Dothidotthia symphoricarpi CBS 119687]|uniref:Uncharacterized protein n=1 Tax=Dothidotthia symphoricarpi CBS 119687 TaxID=1392245 RepID=A0A6A6AH36_9PLEO|nr:uncharacterized protein P153DRAFT_383416 [Dothidotthia symphoricarpi CBS 119687]KAF2131302.1 hypothetical protein P153DRAFT_383416 [Dothidotthia symphoricarpi CBS 119687]
MKPHSLAIFSALLAQGVIAQTCRFPNGTALVDTWPGTGYQDFAPCATPSTMCCALSRDNPPDGDVSRGFTQDICLPSGLCENRNTENGIRGVTWGI